MSEPTSSSTNPTNNAPKAAPQGVPQPKYVISGNELREVALKLAQLILRANLFERRMTTGGKDGKGEKVPYHIWNFDDDSRIGGYNDGITLTPEEAKMLPTTDGVPTVFSNSFVLRQLVVPSMAPAKINERLMATATRKTNKVRNVDQATLLEEINRQRIANGQEPIEF